MVTAAVNGENLQTDKHEDLTSTPFTDALLALREKHRISFHALPISHGQSISKSQLFDKFSTVFGMDFLRTDVTYSGTILDSPILPQYVLKDSQVLTSRAFGALHTMYVTMGTTMANSICIHGLVGHSDRVLVDRTCHQSVHFTLHRMGCKVDYCETQCVDEFAGRYVMNAEDLYTKYAHAAATGHPYRLVILNSLSYEGVLSNVQQIIETCLNIQDNVSFLVDEAWSAFFYFHSWYRRFSAMEAANVLRAQYPLKEFVVVSTQSAHKSLNAIRQASYIHVHGGSDVISRLQKVMYSQHTTSPSYPILCSLELARAQAVLEGERWIDKALQAATILKSELMSVKWRDRVYINDQDFVPGDHEVTIDPLKISINFSRIRLSPALIREALMLKHGIYASRVTESSLLLNVQMGTSTIDIGYFLECLESIVCNAELRSSISHKVLDVRSPLGQFRQDNLLKGDFLIPYPPGVPCLVPSEDLTEHFLFRLKQFHRENVNLIHIGGDDL